MLQGENQKVNQKFKMLQGENQKANEKIQKEVTELKTQLTKQRKERENK